MNKHTPGPWAIDFGGTIGHIKSVATVKTNEDNYMTPTVARYDVKTPSLSEEEKKANARLIAAAPDMYEFIKRYVGSDYPGDLISFNEAQKIIAKIDL